MKTDRELLEAAAKAAGIGLAPNPFMHRHEGFALLADGRRWGPLTDDGDALRLGAAIGMNLTYRKEVGLPRGEVAVTAGKHHAVEGYGSDYMAATRRAIVRAAASLQETKNG